MINELRGQSKATILKYLKNKCTNTSDYSVYQKGISPLMPGWKVYLFADSEEVAIVAIDPDSSSLEEFADEKPINGEHPLYFAQNSRRESPVWRLAVTCNMVENSLNRLSFNHAPRVWGMLLTESSIINYHDMIETWDMLHVSVIDGLSDLQDLSFAINHPKDIPLHIPPVAFACSVGFSEDNIKDALNKLSKLTGNNYSYDNAKYGLRNNT